MRVLNLVLVLLLHNKYEAIDIPHNSNLRLKSPPDIGPTYHDPENEMFEDIDMFTKTNVVETTHAEYVDLPERRTKPPPRQIPIPPTRKKCGIEVEATSYVPSLSHSIEMFPWMGFLTFPIKTKMKYITTVVLVARRLVISSAADIDSLPKLKFRTLARVVLGTNCEGPGIRIEDYTFHPHYKRGTYSALALIQLNARDFNRRRNIHPICGPPAKVTDIQSYAIVMNSDCRNGSIGVHKMEYVPLEECKDFYRKNGLDLDTMWPTYTVCTRSLTADDCVWKEGSILAVKQDGQWRLLGFGVNGPGCAMPSRYIDYSIYYNWIETSIQRIGRPAFTRRAFNQVVLRKTHGIQRFGTCDAGEVTTELFTDETTIDHGYYFERTPDKDVAEYNMSIFTTIDYSCILFSAKYYGAMRISKPPKVEIRYFCLTPWPVCWQAGLERIDFVVRIKFKGMITFKMAAYGRERKVIKYTAFLRMVNVLNATEDYTMPKIPQWRWALE